MPFVAGQKYDAECLEASLIATRTGTTGIQLQFQTSEGIARHTLWLTEKNRENVYRSLDALGVLDPSSFDPNSDLDLLVDARCQVVMCEDNYYGRKDVRVRWIRRAKTVIDDATRTRARAYFGNADHNDDQQAPVNAAPGAAVTSGDDVPF